jgi:predicted XRE-type DNA-binding protein
LGTQARQFPAIDVVDEELFKSRLIDALAERVKTYPSQRAASKAWGVAQPTVNAIANGHVETLTLRQLCNIVWKSGATIQLGLSYSS